MDRSRVALLARAWIAALALGCLIGCVNADARKREQPVQEPGPRGPVEQIPVRGPDFTYAHGEASADSAALIKLLFAGDTHFGWGVADLQRQSGRLAPVENMAAIFHAADFRALNLETSMADRGSPYVRKSYIFNAPPHNLEVLQFLRLDLAVLGNNHSMDLGAQGMDRTLRYLRRSGIAAVGVGEDSRAASDPYVFERGGMRFAVLSFTGVGETETYSTASRAGVASMHDRTVYIAMRAARQRADQVIVNLHWGNEYYPRVDRQQIVFARRLIDMGAAAVIGHHSHVPQGVEIYRGGVICYSLGNFLFGSVNEDQTHNMLAQLEVDPKQKRIARVRIFPIYGQYRTEGNRPRPLTNAEAAAFWQEFYVLARDLSKKSVEGLRIHPDGTGTIDVLD